MLPRTAGRTAINQPCYKQYEDCFKLIMFPFTVLGRELLPLWTLSGEYIGFLAYCVAHHVASYTQHEICQGAKELVKLTKEDRTWNDSPDKLWNFLYTGGLGKLLGPSLGVPVPPREELAGIYDKMREVSCQRLKYDLALRAVQDRGDVCSPQRISLEARGIALEHLVEEKFNEHTPKLASKTAWRAFSSSQDGVDVEEAKRAVYLEALMRRANLLELPDTDDIRHWLCARDATLGRWQAADVSFSGQAAVAGGRCHTSGATASGRLAGRSISRSVQEAS